MYVKLNDRVYLNKDKITRVKVDSVQDGIRIRFYEGQNQVAKSGRFETEAKAIEWLEKNFINKKKSGRVAVWPPALLYFIKLNLPPCG